MPIKKTLGRRFVKYGSANTGEDRPEKRKEDEMMFIPISETFKRLVANPTFIQTLKNHVSKEGVISYFKDGLKFINEADPDVAHIRLYSDEADMCDGLGSRACGQQKFLHSHQRRY